VIRTTIPRQHIRRREAPSQCRRSVHCCISLIGYGCVVVAVTACLWRLCHS
jgi:ABC-type uncharacterized transport system permease subunit